MKMTLPPRSRYFSRQPLAVSDSTQCRYAGAFFPKAKQFIVTGGKFKSITHIHQAAPSAPPGRLGIHLLNQETYPGWKDFPIIPLGHVNLLHRIAVNSGSAVLHHGHGRTSVRRMYSAEIQGCKSKMAVALYQGDGAEEVCFRLCLVHFSFIALHRDGERISRDI
jgi:hypothetical protein